MRSRSFTSKNGCVRSTSNRNPLFQRRSKVQYAKRPASEQCYDCGKAETVIYFALACLDKANWGIYTAGETAHEA